jgi:hypothetical protein
MAAFVWVPRYCGTILVNVNVGMSLVRRKQRHEQTQAQYGAEQTPRWRIGLHDNVFPQGINILKSLGRGDTT